MKQTLRQVNVRALAIPWDTTWIRILLHAFVNNAIQLVYPVKDQKVTNALHALLLYIFKQHIKMILYITELVRAIVYLDIFTFRVLQIKSRLATNVILVACLAYFLEIHTRALHVLWPQRSRNVFKNILLTLL